jgi:ParB family chromosome partitioning protein
VPVPAAAAPQGPPAQRARSGVAAITQTISMHHRVQDLEARVAEYEEANLVVMLEPISIEPGKYRNRDARSFLTPAFAELKSEIEATGRNVQPIKVRRLPAGEGAGARFEVIYGRRRLQACLELGLKVAAVVEDLSDLQVFQEMERENRNRADLSAWEQGMMYRDALDQGLFASQRQLAAALNVNQGNLSMSLKLANLPGEIIDAFATPLDLQFRWAAELSAAYEKSPAKALAVAAELRALPVRLSSKEVFARLTGASVRAALPSMQFTRAGRVVGSCTRDALGNATIRIKADALPEAKGKKLVDFIAKLLEA